MPADIHIDVPPHMRAHTCVPADITDIHVPAEIHVPAGIHVPADIHVAADIDVPADIHVPADLAAR